MGESGVVTVVDEAGDAWCLRTDRLPGTVLAVEADEGSVVVWYEAPPPDRYLMEREPRPRRMTFDEDGDLVVDGVGRRWGKSVDGVGRRWGAVGVAADGSVGRLEDWHPADLWADFQDA